MPNVITFLEEPTGPTYLALLDYARALGSAFSLTWRDQHRFGEPAIDLIRLLAPALLREEHTEVWPGTTLLEGRAWVRRYRLTDHSQSVLAEAGRLFAWEAPSLPEDLAFYTAEGRAWMGSVAHERDAFFDAAEIDLRQIRAAVPGLVIEAGAP